MYINLDESTSVSDWYFLQQQTSLNSFHIVFFVCLFFKKKTGKPIPIFTLWGEVTKENGIVVDRLLKSYVTF